MARDSQVHPAGADAAIHAGTALRKEDDKGMLVSVALGFYGAKEALKGKHLWPTSRIFYCHAS